MAGDSVFWPCSKTAHHWHWVLDLVGVPPLHVLRFPSGTPHCEAQLGVLKLFQCLSVKHPARITLVVVVVGAGGDVLVAKKVCLCSENISIHANLNTVYRLAFVDLGSLLLHPSTPTTGPHQSQYQSSHNHNHVRLENHKQDFRNMNMLNMTIKHEQE